MAKVVFSEFVEPELTAIWDYIAIDNPEAANRFLDSAGDAFRMLAQTPGLGRVRTFTQPRLRQLRSFRVKNFENYLVFYGPIPGGIEVFHILHGARDLDRF